MLFRASSHTSGRPFDRPPVRLAKAVPEPAAPDSLPSRSFDRLTDGSDLETGGRASPMSNVREIGPSTTTMIARSPMAAGDTVSFTRLDEAPATMDRDACLRLGLSSAVIACVATGDGDTDDRLVIALGSASERGWPPGIVDQLRDFAASIATESRADAAEVPAAPHVASGDVHRDDADGARLPDTIVGRSKAMRHVLDQIQQVAVTDSTVLLLGETGVGKEVFATHLHDMSVRRGRPMVRVNCAAIPATLIESELFGREKGAFTGAVARQIGRFELADKSTIFLDEIGDLPPDVQVKLLRVLEERQIERLGNPLGVRVDVRIVAATHRKLEEQLLDGSFREDLFYRLNVFPVRVPPLRERAEDIPSLVWKFVDEFSRAFGKRIDAIPRDNMNALQRHHWPGNIRELRNAVERAMIVSAGPRLTIPVAPRLVVVAGPARSLKMADVEREHLQRVLESTRWRVRGTGGAAELLGLQPTTLEARLLKLGLHRQRS